MFMIIFEQMNNHHGNYKENQEKIFKYFCIQQRQ
jgi:hypothetical protein